MLLGIYITILLLLLASYLRIVATLTVNPGYVRKGPGARKSKATGEKPQLDGTVSEDEDLETGFTSAAGGSIVVAGSEAPPSAGPPLPQPPPPAKDPGPSAPAASRTSMSNTQTQPHSSRQTTNAESQTQGRPYNAWIPARPKLSTSLTNLREFLDKEIFVCENDGLPRYCTTCDCWKPDRSHHCSEVGRCVMRMDHFCPWYVTQYRGTRSLLSELKGRGCSGRN